MELCRDQRYKKAVLFHRIFISALQQWPQHWQRKFLRQAIQNESENPILDLTDLKACQRPGKTAKVRASNPGRRSLTGIAFYRTGPTKPRNQTGPATTKSLQNEESLPAGSRSLTTAGRSPAWGRSGQCSWRAGAWGPPGSGRPGTWWSVQTAFLARWTGSSPACRLEVANSFLLYYFTTSQY